MAVLSWSPRVLIEDQLGMFIPNLRLGCGVEVKVVRGRRYLYFWSYGFRAGRSTRIWRYLGPAGTEKSKRKALSKLDEYGIMAKGELEGRIRAVRTRILRSR